MSFSLRIKFSFIGLTYFLSGCTPTIDNHGYERNAIDFSKITPGLSQEDVLQKLGSPSTVSSFEAPIWYYATKVTETKAFFHPKVIEQRVIAIQFDEKGGVKSVKEVKDADYKDIIPNKAVTPTSGYESGVFKEIFSNFGRISNKSAKK